MQTKEFKLHLEAMTRHVSAFNWSMKLEQRAEATEQHSQSAFLKSNLPKAAAAAAAAHVPAECPSHC